MQLDCAAACITSAESEEEKGRGKLSFDGKILQNTTEKAKKDRLAISVVVHAIS